MASDIGKLKQVFADILDGIHSQKMMNKLGLAQQRNIQKRTREGRDLLENAFRPYNPIYARRKTRKTGIPTNVVNLIYDDVNGMMKSIDHVVFNDFTGVELFFTDDQKKRLAEFHNILGAGKSKVIRNFWGVSKPEEESLAELVEAELNLILQKLSEE